MTAHELIERCAQMLEERDARGLEDYLANEIRALKQQIPDGAICEAEPVAWELRMGKTDRVLMKITNDPQQERDWRISWLGDMTVPLYRAAKEKQA